MHEHDTNLIMALAEGSLDPAQIAAAEAELSDCPDCASELALQRAALLMLRAAPPAELNDIERTRIRRNIRDELGITKVSTAATSSVRNARRFRLIAGLAGAAAVLVAIVLVAPALDDLTIGGADDAGSFEAAIETTAAAGATEAAPEPTMSSDRASVAEGDAPSLDATSDVVGDGAATTAAPATTVVPSIVPEALAYTYYSGLELEQLPDLTALAEAILATRSVEFGFGPPSEIVNLRLNALDEETCLAAGLRGAPESDSAYILG
ncbi:MAG: hypothetical protein OEM97_11510, partial [Acidimicrobiia bacterium]|nr:hypothetical protein [Acidimicrobiia bacterium]